MRFLPPFVVFGTHGLDDEGIRAQGRRYRALLEALAMGEPDDAERERLATAVTLNGFVTRLAEVGS
jgi:hypothetical protein